MKAPRNQRKEHPGDDLARTLLSCRRPMHLPPTNYDSSLRIIRNFHLRQGCAKCFFSQSFKPNELIFNTMFYDSVRLKGPRG